MAQFLQNSSLKDVIGEGPRRQGKMVVLQEEHTVREALGIFAQYQISSAAVVRGKAPQDLPAGENETYYGLINILDLLVGVCLPLQNPLDFAKKTEEEEAMLEEAQAHPEKYDETRQNVIKSVMKRLAAETFNSPAVDLLAVSNESQGFWSFDESDTLYTVLRKCLTQHNHRAIVRQKSDKPGEKQEDSIVAQSDLIRYLCAHKQDDELQPMLMKTVEELGLSKRKVVTAKAEESALSACRKIYQNPYISSCAVTNSRGELKESFSASNLRGLSEQTVAALFTNVCDYLKLFPGTRVAPVCVTQDETMETIIEAMNSKGIHQVWVVEDKDSMRLQGVVTMSDVLREVMLFGEDAIENNLVEEEEAFLGQ